MKAEQYELGDGFWLSLASTFGARRALHADRAAAALPLDPPPLAALFPEDAPEVSIVLDAVRAERIPVVVCGRCSRLGETVSGGPDFACSLPQGGYVALDMRNLAGVEETHAESLWMAVRAGTTVREAVRAAEEHGCRPAGLGDGDGSVGGWLATHARIDDWILGIPQPPVLSVEAVLPTGNLVRSVPVPRAAVGPDLFSLFAGTWGAFGVVTRVILKLEPMPERSASLSLGGLPVERAVGLMRSVAIDCIPPREAALVIDGPAGRKKTAIRLEFSGERALVEAGVRSARRLGERAGAACADGSIDSGIPGGFHCGGSVAWSGVSDALRGAERRLGGVARAVLDRPAPDGCRLRLELRAPSASVQEDFDSLVDPGGSIAAARRTAGACMESIRRELDPLGLLNPQAWPLPSGEAGR